MKEIRDRYCANIFLTLIVKKQARFNELYNMVARASKEKFNKEKAFSKPTFNKHLNHLIDDGFVIKKVEKKQHVTLIINYEKIGKTEEYIDRMKRIIKTERENKKEFYSLPEDDQIKELIYFFSMRELHKIQARIDFELDPESFDKWFAVQLWYSSLLENPTGWMIEKCVTDEVYRNKITAIINKWLEK